MTMTFTQAYERLQEIHQLLQGDEMVDIEDIIKIQEEAKVCYDLCVSKIENT